MARMVFCKRLKKEAEGLEKAPLYGALGKEIFENSSAEAWNEWEEMQLKIVNEYHLDLAEKEHRETLRKQLRVFLGFDEEGESLDIGNET